MKAVGFIEYGGVEIANENRVADYLNAGLLTGLAITDIDCGCDLIDEGPYVSPSADPAPWYDSTRPESDEYLGLLAYDIRIDPVIRRSISPRSLHGASIGPLRARHRIVAVRGLLLASSAQGMAYGERWLNDVLAGTLSGCGSDTMRLLLACPPSSYAVVEAQFRSLREVAIADGPTTAAVQELPECYVSDISFQIAAGIPQLLSDEIACLPETTLAGGS